MPRVRVPYSVQGGNQLIMQPMRWPNVCICCNQPSPAALLQIKHAARKTQKTTYSGMQRTEEFSRFDLSWSLPACPACFAHDGRSRNPLRLDYAILIGIVVDVAALFGLYDLGLDLNAAPGIAAAIALLCATAVIASLISLGYGRVRRRQAATMMTVACTCPGPVIDVKSTMDDIYFSIPNAAYAQAVVSGNAGAALA